MVHIPYRGIAPAFTDLMGGQTQAMFPGLAAACRTSARAACGRWP
jgi:tripartite-type tricarboxylate transporter receptor subunit TctC